MSRVVRPDGTDWQTGSTDDVTTSARSAVAEQKLQRSKTTLVPLFWSSSCDVDKTVPSNRGDARLASMWRILVAAIAIIQINWMMLLPRRIRANRNCITLTRFTAILCRVQWTLHYPTSSLATI